MGLITSAFEDELKENLPNTKERFYGLENFGNTCYVNSVLQALYFCVPFRKKILLYYKEIIEAKENEKEEKDRYILYNLAKLFYIIYSKEKTTGTISPNSFIEKLRRINVIFQPNMQQDANEFWNYIVNNMCETIRQKQKRETNLRYLKIFEHTRGKTFVDDMFEGVLSNTTKCLTCENKTLREEIFFDISVEIGNNTTVLECLKKFTDSEFLHKSEKFFCDFCGCLQEAKKEIFFNRLPKVLVIHLKRFKYNEEIHNYTKLSNRVAYPLSLEISDEKDPLIKYELFSFVVHLGKSPSFGHYVSIVKCEDNWFLFNDEEVKMVPKNALNSFFGNDDPKKHSNCAYILFYKRTN